MATKISEEEYASPSHLSIKFWAEEDRPREKMVLQGRAALSEAELLAILLGTGTREVSALGLAQRLLASFDNDLFKLSRATLTDLQKLKGIGEAKAISVAAGLELGRRRQKAEVKKQTKITASIDAYNFIVPHLLDLDHEQFWILLVNRGNFIVGQERISSGGVAGTVVDPKIIFRSAIQQLASGLVLVHNHPSGNKKPSQADISLTKKLKIVGEMLEIFILDHLIITDSGYLSFADEQLL